MHPKENSSEHKGKTEAKTSTLEERDPQLHGNAPKEALVEDQRLFSRNSNPIDQATGLNFYETVSRPRRLSLEEEELLVPKIPPPVDHCTITFSDGKTAKMPVLESTDGVRYIDIRFSY